MFTRSQALQAKITDLEAKNKDLRAKNKDLRAKNKDLKAKYTDLEAKYIASQNSIEGLVLVLKDIASVPLQELPS